MGANRPSGTRLGQWLQQKPGCVGCFMDRISSRIQVVGGVSTLVASGFHLSVLASLGDDFQFALERFVAEYKAA